MSYRVARWYLIVTSCWYELRDKATVWWFLAMLFYLEDYLLQIDVIQSVKKGIERNINKRCIPFTLGINKNLESPDIRYIPRNMHTVFALLCFVVVIHWLIFPYPSGLLHWHCGNLTIAPVPAKQPWWIWINTSCEFIMNDCITTTKQSTTKPCAYFLGYTVACLPWIYTPWARDMQISAWYPICK